MFYVKDSSWFCQVLCTCVQDQQVEAVVIALQISDRCFVWMNCDCMGVYMAVGME